MLEETGSILVTGHKLSVKQEGSSGEKCTTCYDSSLADAEVCFLLGSLLYPQTGSSNRDTQLPLSPSCSSINQVRLDSHCRGRDKSHTSILEHRNFCPRLLSINGGSFLSSQKSFTLPLKLPTACASLHPVKKGSKVLNGTGFPGVCLPGRPTCLK